MSTGRPRAVFLSGDEDKAFEMLKDLKREWHPEGVVHCEWEEYDPENSRSKGADIESLLESLMCPPLNECHRTLILKTPGDNIKTKQILIKLVEKIPENTTLILWDTKGLLSSKKQSSPTWKEVVEVFKKHGKVIDSGKKLKDLSDVSKIAWVVKTGESVGLTIPSDCAEMLLDLFDNNRIMIKSEIENLAFMSDGMLHKDSILENAMPIQKDYPIYKFYSAFNEGTYRSCMSAAQELLDRGFKVDVLLNFVIKQARWQVVVSDAIRKREDPKSLTESVSSSDHIKARVKLEADKSINRRFFLQNPSEMKDDELPKIEKPPSSFAIDEMTRFMAVTLSKLIPPTEKDKRGAIHEQLLRRYVTLLDGMLELRLCKSDEKEACFSRIIRRVTF